MLDDAIVIPRLLIGGLESPTRSRLSPRVGHVVLRPHDVRAPPLPAAHESTVRQKVQSLNKLGEYKWRYRVVDEGGSPRDEAITVLDQARALVEKFIQSELKRAGLDVSRSPTPVAGPRSGAMRQEVGKPRLYSPINSLRNLRSVTSKEWAGSCCPSSLLDSWSRAPGRENCEMRLLGAFVEIQHLHQTEAMRMSATRGPQAGRAPTRLLGYAAT